MVLISFTNIVVDQFSFGKGTQNKFVYFLTHWHSDHYSGIHNGWKRGKIYCSEVTRKLMLTKFPKLDPLIIPLQLDIQHKIQLKGNLSVKVRIFDSNHIAGSIMVLFEGYFGRILHSGDMRFHQNMLKTNPYLFPNYKQQSYQGCSLQIDQLILDNTYCDPIFKFPLRSVATQLIVKIIDMNPNKRILLATDTIGKQQAFICLSKYYNTQIQVNRQRYNYIKCMNVDRVYFTTKSKNTWIEVIKKHQKQEKMEQHPKSICITLTGWANIRTYHEYNPRQFIVPYSLHSNFLELDTFVKAIKPGIIKPIVKSKGRKSERINNIKQFSSYMSTGMFLYQRGLDFFVETYCNQMKNTSKQYRQLCDSTELQLSLNQQLGIVRDSSKLTQFTQQESGDYQMIENEERDKD